jgi:hypothetical protein
MALDPSTTEKLGNWFNTQATPAQQDPAVSGQGMIGSVQSSFDPDSGVFGVQTATAGTPAPTTPTMLNLGDLDRRTVDAGKETVAGQLDSILKQDSPLMESARARAKQEANSRGLLNSTMAATAGEKAMIDSAMPIAQADAGTHGCCQQGSNPTSGDRCRQGNARARHPGEIQAAGNAGSDREDEDRVGECRQEGIDQATATA